MKLTFESNDYSMLECFVKGNEQLDCGTVSIYTEDGKAVESRQISCCQAECIRLSVKRYTTYVLIIENVKIGEIYLSNCPNIFSRGIQYLVPDEEQRKLICPDLGDWYDVIQKEQYHFSPFINWMNDPNGLCFYKGYYHMFYQKNPFEQIWGSMYWGHAVSRDLVHWVHLPIALEPQQEILKDGNIIGGAFSGSAYVKDGELKILFTRDLEDKNHEKSAKQWQVTVSGKDGIHFENEEEVVPAFSVEGASENFRDPKVTKINGSWYMVLGSQVNKKAAILLYKSEDLKEWKYLHPLIIEEDENIEAFECPDFFFLDGKYVVTGAWMSYKDEYGRFNPMRYYIGSFEEDVFEIESEGFCDFGCDYYATQSFFGCDRRINISWIPDWRMQQKEYKNGCKGSMSIPRELHIVNGSLIQKPIPEIYSLMQQELVCTKGKNIYLENVPGNTFYAKAEFEGETDFEIFFARREDREYSLKKAGNEIEIIGENGDARYITHISKVTAVEIFVDRRVVEVFINGGEAAGTKLILTNSKKGTFRAVFSKVQTVKEIKVAVMESVWK